MNQATHDKIVSFIWGIADDVLHDPFKRGKYQAIVAFSGEDEQGVAQRVFEQRHCRKEPDRPLSLRYYYRTTLLAEETDPNKLLDLKAALDAAQVYSPAQVLQVVAMFLDGADRRQALTAGFCSYPLSRRADLPWLCVGRFGKVRLATADAYP